MFADVIKVFIL